MSIWPFENFSKLSRFSHSSLKSPPTLLCKGGQGGFFQRVKVIFFNEVKSYDFRKIGFFKMISGLERGFPPCWRCGNEAWEKIEIFYFKKIRRLKMAVGDEG